MGAREQLVRLAERMTSSLLFKQAVGAIVLILAVLLVVHTPLPILEPVRLQVREKLAADYDFRAVFERVRSVEVREVVARVKTGVLGVQQNGGAQSLEGLRAPVTGSVVSAFGWRTGPDGEQQLHEGLDIAVAAGTTVVAAGDGVVLSVQGEPGAGVTVAIDHGAGVTTVYGQLARAVVQPGETVNRGEALGTVGPSEESTLSYLYFELRVDGKAIDPAPKISLSSGS